MYVCKQTGMPVCLPATTVSERKRLAGSDVQTVNKCPTYSEHFQRQPYTKETGYVSHFVLLIDHNKLRWNKQADTNE